MAGLADFRAQHPEYNDMPDGALADALHAKFYSDIPKQEFDQKMGLQAAPSKVEPMSLGETAGKAALNFIPSAVNLGKNVYQAVRHPINTAGTILDLGSGELQKLTPEPIRNAVNHLDFNPEASARANSTASNVNDFYTKRYGSMEGVKNAIAEDPAGVLADVSVLAGGTGAALKGGGLTKAAAVADKLGTVSNPVTLAANGLGKVGRGAGKLLSEGLGATTGTSGPTIRTAFGAGLEGGPAADAFRSHISGNAPIEEVVSDARNAVGNLRSQRGADYRVGMGPVNSDPTVLSLNPIDQAVSQSNSINSFKGIDLSPSTAAVRQKIANTIDLWKNQNPQDFHTAAGFDALKKAIGDIRDSAPYGTPERVIADQAYNAVKSEITSQAPAYAKTMSDYAKASDQIGDIQKTLSLGNKAGTDTSVRKLQSALRDNVNTSYGRRADLAKILADNGAPQLMEKIAGQQLNAGTTRGIGKILASGEIGGALTSALMGHPGTAAALVPALALSSPRFVGEASFAAGKAGRLGKLLKGLKPADKSAVLAAELGQQRNPQQNSAGLLAPYLLQNQVQP